MRMFFLIALSLVLAGPLSHADETAAPVTPVAAVEAGPVQASESVPAEDAAPAAKIVVLLPEQVDSEWFWYFYSDTGQHIVQSAVEKSLVNAGFDVIDTASIEQLKNIGSIEAATSTEGAKQVGAAAGAQYAVVGKATAVKGSLSTAYNVTVVRSSAEITAKILRISDGKILAVVDGSAEAGGQAQRSAGQAALKQAGQDVARKLALEMRKITSKP
jgi:hypothetical protein